MQQNLETKDEKANFRSLFLRQIRENQYLNKILMTLMLILYNKNKLETAELCTV